MTGVAVSVRGDEGVGAAGSDIACSAGVLSESDGTEETGGAGAGGGVLCC